MPTVHIFTTSGEAYDASQCWDTISDGDVLSVPSEMVVGILIEAWPTAISERCGEFHVLSEDVKWSAIPSTTYGSPSDYSASYEAAAAELSRVQRLVHASFGGNLS